MSCYPKEHQRHLKGSLKRIRTTFIPKLNQLESLPNSPRMSSRPFSSHRYIRTPIIAHSPVNVHDLILISTLNVTDRKKEKKNSESDIHQMKKEINAQEVYQNVLEFMETIESNESPVFHQIDQCSRGHFTKSDLYEYLRRKQRNRKKYSKVSSFHEDNSLEKHMDKYILVTTNLALKLFDIEDTGTVDRNQFLGVCSIFAYFVKKPFNLVKQEDLNQLSYWLAKSKELYKHYTENDIETSIELHWMVKYARENLWYFLRVIPIFSTYYNFK